MIDAYELALHQADLADLLTTTCRVLGYEDTDGVQDWDATVGNVPCLVGQPSAGANVPELFYDGTEPTAVIWMRGDVPVQTGARIVTNNLTYKVVHVPVAHSIELMRGLVCIEVRTPGEAH